MKIYLCTHCNRKVPRAELLEHRKTCGAGADYALKQGLGRKASGGLKGILLVGLAVLLGSVSVFLGYASFSSLAAMRRLERIPAVTVNAVLPGEVNLNGRVVAGTRTLTSPRTNTTCVYYRYVVEREERDSDGDTRWVTEVDRQVYTEFFLEDATGRMGIHPSDRVSFRVRKSHASRSGNRRYTEYRIDPGASVFVFGLAVEQGAGMGVRFDRQGHYDPLISVHGETRERTRMAGASIAKGWFGLVAMAFALSVVIHLLRIHRLLVYFSLLNLVVMTYLVLLGLNMMKLDLQAAVERIEQHEHVARETVKAGLTRDWDGDWATLGALDPADPRLERLALIRFNLARAIERVRQQRSAFPERWLAPLWGIPKRAPLPMPPDERERLLREDPGAERAKIPPVIGLVLIGVASTVGVLTFGFGFRRVRFKRCMENLPTSPAAGAAYGLSEFKGVVEVPESAQALKGPLSLQPCVEYHYLVKEKRGSGKNSRWVTLVNERRHCPFRCRDPSGAALLDPRGAEIFTTHHTSRGVGRTRYTETRLEVGDPLYAIGECVIEPARGDRLYLRKPSRKEPFLLANLTENQVMLRVARRGILLLNVSFAAILLAALLLFGLSGSFAATDYLAAAMAAPLYMTLVTLALHYNDLVFLRERVRRNAANIDVSLKKRHDLVPRLEEIASVHRNHEREVNEALTRLRSAYGMDGSKDPAAVGKRLTAGNQAVGGLMLLGEAYPELKADRSMALLMRTLIVLENEIALMRSGHNDAVETYNTRIQTLPDLIFAKIFHFTEGTFLHAETEVVRVPPSIQALWEKGQNSRAPISMEGRKDTEPPEPSETPVAALAAASGTTSAAGVALEEDSDAGASARCRVYALLLDSEPHFRIAQLERIASDECPDIAKRVESLLDSLPPAGEEIERLLEAEKQFDVLKEMVPETYRTFRSLVQALIEADAEVSLFEYALHTSMNRTLEPAFGLAETRPLRHRDFTLLLEQASLVLSRFALAEENPEHTAGEMFAEGVKNLNHRPTSDFHRIAPEKCTLAAFDQAAEEIGHAANMVKANVQYACEAAVKLNDVYTMDQALLLVALADILERDRPTWVLGEGHP